MADTKSLVASDDISILLDDGTAVDLLMNAVPILNDDGSISAIVAAFQDISALRNLERTLETNLRETVALYETTRALAEAEEVEEVLDQVLGQLATQDVSEAYVLLLDERGGRRADRSVAGRGVGNVDAAERSSQPAHRALHSGCAPDQSTWTKRLRVGAASGECRRAGLDAAARAFAP